MGKKDVVKLYFTLGGLCMVVSLIMLCVIPTTDHKLVGAYAIVATMGFIMIVLGGMVYMCGDEDKED